MSPLSIQVPFPVFQGRDGQPLENGYVWIGTANLNPQTNPVVVYWDAALTIPAAQPLRTLNGYISRAGSPAQIYVDGVNFSILVQDSKGSMVYNFPEGTGIQPNAAGVIYTPPVGGVPTNVQDKLARYISVLDFGADPTGATDSTAAFQAALDSAKGANGTGIGKSVFSLYVPSYPGGFYKISDTLLIDGTYGLKLYGDGAFTKRLSADTESTIRWYGTRKPIIQVQGRTDAVSNPNFLIQIKDLTMSGFPTTVDPTTGIPANMALSGIHIGNIDAFSENTLTRGLSIENVWIENCRFGIWSGNPDALNTDHAVVNIDRCNIINCPQAGISWGTGNAVGSSKGCKIFSNGWGSASFPADDYSPQIGANIYVASGYLDLISITTAGVGTSKPVDADIYQASGRVSIINAWSDTHGYFFYQAGASTIAGVGYQTAQITGVRHFEGNMTAVNTPNSLYITVPGTVVSACTLYGNVVVQSGLTGRPIFSGIQFGRTNATFIGSGIDTQRTLINIGSGSGNSAQITMGGADAGVPLTQKGDNPVPNMLFLNNAVSLFELAPAVASGTGFHWYARGDDANGPHQLYFNCYYDTAAGGYVPYQNTKLCARVQLGGTRGFQVAFADPGSSPGVLTFTTVGGFIAGNATGLRLEAAWEFPKNAGDPTFNVGDFWEGSVYYDTTTNKLRVNTGGTTWVDLH